ncbi:formate dehydrogenase subunit delta [Microbulbifer sp.]|uniref:formate dehydrogenase subunit delta n=1 Tax=Microbulbifer sp. TaxID=1908541 RepID=UPI003F3B4BBF
MSTEKLEHLVRMANQIAANLDHGKADEEALEAVANHLSRFWARRMKAQIIGHLHSGGEGLDPLARRAVERISRI